MDSKEDEKNYYIFNVDQLSKIEKDIIFTLGNEVINISTNFYGIKLKRMETIKNILNYNDDELYKGLSVLVLKDLIGLKKTWRDSIDVEKARNDVVLNIFGMIICIYNRLEQNKGYLKQDAINFLNKEYLESEEKDVGDRLKAIRLECKDFDTLFRVASGSQEKLKDYQLRIIELYLTLIDYIKNPDDLLLQVAEKYFDKDKVLGAEYLFLTNHQNCGINGTQVFYSLSSIDLLKEIDNRVKQSEDLEKRVIEVEKSVSSSLVKNIEIISIFVAVITLIIGNVSFVPQIEGATLLEVLSPILLINGCLLAGVSSLVLLISKVVVRENSKAGVAGWVALGLAVVLLIVGIVLAVI